MASPMQSGASDLYPPKRRLRHPIVTVILTVFTLLPIGLILALVVTGFIWTPWEVHAFQATDDGELALHAAQLFVDLLVGIPLAILGLTCGHFAAWLAWPERSTITRRDTSPSTSMLAKRALIVVLLICLVLGYLSIIVQGFYVVFRLIAPEHI